MAAAKTLCIAVLLALALAASADNGGRGGAGGVYPHRAVNDGTIFHVDGDINLASQGATADAILSAASGASKAALAARVGAKAALTTTESSSGLKVFDRIAKSQAGGRKMLSGGTMSRSDRTAVASIAASDAIAASIAGGRKAVKGATSKSMSFAKLAGSEAARPADFLP